MKRVKMRTLRSVLFLLLALVFAVLAMVEGMPRARQSVYSQATAFAVTSQKQSDGSYFHLVEGSIKNDSNKKQFLDGIVVRILDQEGDTHALEMEIGSMAPGEERKLSGSLTSNSPAVSVKNVSTSALSGDLPIPLSERGLQFNKGFVIFAVLALASLGASVFFFVDLQKHRHHHHHHHQKSDKNQSQEV